MNLTRRTFLAAAGLGALGLTGCGNTPMLELLTLAKPALGKCLAPASDLVDLESHTLSRLSFGMRPGDYDRIQALGIEQYVEEQLKPESIDDSACDQLVRRFEALNAPLGELFEYRDGLLLQELTRATLLRAVYSERQLYEVMVEFWSDHFNISIFKGDCPWLKVADDRDVIRKHALGSFRELLRASALSPAMLWYLDGRVNQKANDDEHPNENYARELLELHTLGVHGGYTQHDVMEVARCLTGWTVRSDELFFKGRVEFKKFRHEDGEKTVLGETIPAGLGEGDLDRVLDLVVKHPSTSNYLSQKLCRRFIGDGVDEATIHQVATAFADSDGDIKTTLRAVIRTDAFQHSRGTKFKRPFRFLASALRATNAQTTAEEAVIDSLMRMGHLPFQYPTPDGYPDESEPWTGTLLWRWRAVNALCENKAQDVTVDWEELLNAYGAEDSLAAHFLGRTPNQTERNALSKSGLGPVALLASPAFQRF